MTSIVAAGSTRHFQFDSASRLVCADTAQNGCALNRLHYDVDGRRVLDDDPMSMKFAAFVDDSVSVDGGLYPETRIEIRAFGERIAYKRSGDDFRTAGYAAAPRPATEELRMFHTEPEFIAITPELRERLEKFRTQHAGDKIGKVANHVLFEDENVRIWEMRLEPGEHSDLHHHPHDYYLVIDSGDLVAGIPPKNSGMDFFIGKVPAQGNTVRVPKGGTEWALNVGKQTYHEILIELKKT